ncbi:MAG: MCE family protein [Verrucomicrobia bacterium]|jgi:paraquat-inducible protein B|nr:MCE family protein [Verrucomicrobiota bacterium]OQC66546.1 MAG: Paraquat-inducible protein B [Verrucomicrobia bacterium ADurb.Bin006]MDI9382005.1 MlaD family protein [Verrucomicrobiota bacterium]NMD18702.1 MCE family protein [Verrucomicrobiota bacterium]HNU99712.1 MlaD family protein [Verrucomicrobiota bacterium]
MSTRVKPATIGVFVVCGLALAVAGVVMSSSSRWFSRTEECIAYFDGSLNGLDNGAPVKYRGVPIGYVKRVMARYNQAPADNAMPVLMEIQERLIVDRLGPKAAARVPSGLSAWLTENTRATLEAESLLTGVLYVNIEAKSNPAPPVFHQLDAIYPEIPTEPTRIQQIIAQLTKVDLAGLADRLTALITRLDSKLGEIKTAEISDGLTNLIASLDGFINSPELSNTLASARATLDEYRSVGSRVGARIDPLADGLHETLAQSQKTLADIRGAAANLEMVLGGNAPLWHDLGLALDQLAAAAQSISGLADFLKAHPNALISGRRTPRGSLDHGRAAD